MHTCAHTDSYQNAPDLGDSTVQYSGSSPKPIRRSTSFRKSFLRRKKKKAKSEICYRFNKVTKFWGFFNFFVSNFVVLLNFLLSLFILQRQFPRWMTSKYRRSYRKRKRRSDFFLILSLSRKWNPRLKNRRSRGIKRRRSDFPLLKRKFDSDRKKVSEEMAALHFVPSSIHCFQLNIQAINLKTLSIQNWQSGFVCLQKVEL